MATVARVNQAPRRHRIKAAIGILVVVGIAAIATWILADLGRRREIESIVDSPAGLLALFILSALSSATLLLPVPGIALTVVAASVANPILVGLTAGLGQAIGELTGYMAGSSGGALVRDRLAAGALAGWMRRRGTVTVFVLSVVPNPAFDVAGMLAGALGLPLPRFLLATAAGKVVRNVVIAVTVVHGDALL